MSAPMVRAILEGRKTQTRRVMNPQPKEWAVNSSGSRPIIWKNDKPVDVECPYGQPGDRLWVRETFRLTTGDDCACYEPCQCKSGVPVYYASCADDECKWKPSIFMPRWASRITLEIVEVRVQRVQEISHKDAISEGCPDAGDISAKTWDESGISRRVFEDSQNRRNTIFGAKAEYSILWDSINSKRGFGWDKNPWVWAITFKRL